MNIVIFLLSFILVLSSLFLILLVLVQLPKKEAGLGQAFGSGATDALFGPGSGNMLTKMTKWTAAIFFTLTIFIWILQGHNARAKGIDPRSKLTAAEKAALDPKAPPAATPASTNQSTNLSLLPNTTTNAESAVLKPANTNPPAAAK
jgi:preprotein translocase subunit SecG